MTDPAVRTRKIFLYSCIFAICTLSLLFIIFYIFSRCGNLILTGAADSCLVGTGAFWFETGFLVAAIFCLYRVHALMNTG